MRKTKAISTSVYTVISITQSFFLLAYQKIYANEGNMTAGTDGKTIDGMGMERVNRLIESLKDHSYQPNPAKRQYIKKKNGKMRPWAFRLLMTSWCRK